MASRQRPLRKLGDDKPANEMVRCLMTPREQSDRNRQLLARWLIGGSRRGDTVVQAMAKSAARTMGSTVGRQIILGVLGSLLDASSNSRR